MRTLKTSINRKADHTVAGEMVMNVRDLLQEDLTIEQRLEALKAGNSALTTRINLRAENRKDALAKCGIEEHNLKYQSKIKIENIELADIEE